MDKKKMTDRIRQFIRYFFVGGIASVVDYGFSNTMYWLITAYLLENNEMLAQNLSSLSGIIVGLLVNYFMASRIVFHSENSLKDFLQICLITVVSCVLTFGLTSLNVRYLRLPFAFFKIVTMGIAFLWNYLARSLWVYNEDHTKHKAA